MPKQGFKQEFNMDYKKILTAIMLSLITLSVAFAETVWEGSAAMSRYGEFPVNGLYGASNSFPVNTIISVENPKNKKTIEIIIVNSLSDKNLFLLLSKDVSEYLDIKQDEIIPVKAKIVKEVTLPRMSEKVSNTDPDNNPSSAESLLLPEENKRESGVVIYEEAEFPEIDSLPDAAEEGEGKAETGSDIPVVEYIIADSDFLTTDTEPDDMTAEADKETDETAELSPLEKEKIDYEKKYILSPSSPKPPVPNGAETLERTGIEDKITADTDKKLLPKTTEGEFDAIARKTFESPAPLSNSGYTEKLEKKPYLQLAAFSDYEGAKQKFESVNIDYPALIYYDRSTGIYRLLAGPLNNDEKGAALYNLRKKGFKDAFIKQGE